jgi:OOP family OmpA-OmpF porin
VFGQPTVTIEGHTDSSGSALTNLKLSQTRAEAVKTYLVANYTLPENLISAAGYGPDRPLAPNTTPEGRAANRRIDVVITPSQTPQD